MMKKYFFSSLALLGAVVSLSAQIVVSPVCTFQQSDTFFSARRLSIHSGRIFTGILLQESESET